MRAISMAVMAVMLSVVAVRPTQGAAPKPVLEPPIPPELRAPPVPDASTIPPPAAVTPPAASATPPPATRATPIPKSRLRQIAPDADPDVTTIYRGTLGDALIQMRITAKPDEPGGYSGDYFVYGGGRSMLIAGEIDDEEFFLEESDDGERISGSWEGKLVIEGNRGFIVGVWRNADETETRPFKLERVMRTRTVAKRST